MKNAILLSNGLPTRYGFACGYTKTFDINNQYVHIWLEHGLYNVSYGTYGSTKDFEILSYYDLSQARKSYINKMRQLKKANKTN